MVRIDCTWGGSKLYLSTSNQTASFQPNNFLPTKQPPSNQLQTKQLPPTQNLHCDQGHRLLRSHGRCSLAVRGSWRWRKATRNLAYPVPSWSAPRRKSQAPRRSHAEPQTSCPQEWQSNPPEGFAVKAWGFGICLSHTGGIGVMCWGGIGVMSCLSQWVTWKNMTIRRTQKTNTDIGRSKQIFFHHKQIFFYHKGETYLSTFPSEEVRRQATSSRALLATSSCDATVRVQQINKQSF